jgi:streptogramin lyase
VELPPVARASLEAEITRLLEAGDREAAERAYRKAYRCTLAEAQMGVAALEAANHPALTSLAAEPAPQPNRLWIWVALIVALFAGAGWALQNSERQQLNALQNGAQALPTRAATLDTTALAANLLQQTMRTPTPGIAAEVGAIGNGGATGSGGAIGNGGAIRNGGGEGQFNDARSIAIDAQGRIYVGEYTGGRIQVFDKTGKYLTEWSVDAKMPLRGMAAAADGALDIVQKGIVQRYDGLTGQALEPAAVQVNDLDDIAANASGSWAVAQVSASADNLLLFDAGNRLVATLPNAVSQQTGGAELNLRIALDRLGNLYALSSAKGVVLVFDTQGRLVRQIGAAAEGGSFTAPLAIAVDNSGRVFVSDIAGIHVFNPNGDLLGRIPVDGGVAYGLTFAPDGTLYAACGTRVAIYALDPTKLE